MMSRMIVARSKFLSKHLRHAPEKIGIKLGEGGWVEVQTLLTAAVQAGMHMNRAQLEEVVRENDKQRFSFDETGQFIRASQGHSVEVDLELETLEPPAVLYHGTPQHNLEAIQEEGILKQRRNHVHLSLDRETARKVGQRHGRPVVLVIDAAAMHAAGIVFHRSDNGVWLTDSVPPQYLTVYVKS
jgi:putative RNA 2'-phosphotransferase